MTATIEALAKRVSALSSELAALTHRHDRLAVAHKKLAEAYAKTRIRVLTDTNKMTVLTECSHYLRVAQAPDDKQLEWYRAFNWACDNLGEAVWKRQMSVDNWVGFIIDQFRKRKDAHR